MIGEGVIARIFPPPFQPMYILRIPIVHLEKKENREKTIQTYYMKIMLITMLKEIYSLVSCNDV